MQLAMQISSNDETLGIITVQVIKELNSQAVSIKARKG